MNQDYYLLNHLDEPVRFLFFTLGEFIVILVPFMLGMLVDRMLLGLVFGALCYQVLKLVNRNFHGANLKQIIYWFLPTSKRMLKLNIPSCVRELQG